MFAVFSSGGKQHRVKEGEEYNLNIPVPETNKFQAEDIPLNIIFESGNPKDLSTVSKIFFAIPNFS